MLKFWRKYIKTWEQTICRRKSDGTLWIASHNNHYKSMLALFGYVNKFYFRRVHLFGKSYISSYTDTWSFNDGEQFDIVKKSKIYANRKEWNKHLKTI